MGLHDRPYMRRGPDAYDDGYSGGGGLRFAFPKPSRAVVEIMIACAALGLLCVMTGRRDSALYTWLALWPKKAFMVWQFITFQFMHRDFQHILFNLIGLYFFGVPLEREWGRRRFWKFYLACGAFSGLCYLAIAGLLALVRPGSGAWSGSIAGASGGVLACLAACAVLYPRMLLLFIPIRIAAPILAIIYFVSVAHGDDLGDAAHLGGMAAAVGWLWLAPRIRAGRAPHGDRGEGRWQKKLQRQAKRQAEIDAILDKIRESGLDALSRGDQRRLQQLSKEHRDDE